MEGGAVVATAVMGLGIAFMVGEEALSRRSRDGVGPMLVDWGAGHGLAVGDPESVNHDGRWRCPPRAKVLAVVHGTWREHRVAVACWVAPNDRDPPPWAVCRLVCRVGLRAERPDVEVYPRTRSSLHGGRGYRTGDRSFDKAFWVRPQDAGLTERARAVLLALDDRRGLRHSRLEAEVVGGELRVVLLRWRPARFDHNLLDNLANGATDLANALVPPPTATYPARPPP